MTAREKIIRKVKKEAEELERLGRLGLTRNYMQHGNISVYTHCVRVAIISCLIAEYLRLRIDRRALIRGALLHDYFLYDWHRKGEGHRLHGFFHAGKALRNARADYRLSAVEENIIERHMFPLTAVPPTCREAWVVCLADKWCAANETVKPVLFKFRRNFSDFL